MYSVISAALVTLASASAQDFPAFDRDHAHCAVSAVYPGIACDTVYSEFDSEIRSWFTGDVSAGVYAITEESPSSFIWSTRTTPVYKFVDDQIFELTQTDDACEVVARSRSQTHSIYDFSTNYCNMWNVMNTSGGMEDFKIDYNNCPYYPSNSEETCSIY
jgi:hypothetical protein